MCSPPGPPSRRDNIDRHRGFMVGNYMGLVGAFVGVLAVHTRRVPAWFAAEPMTMSPVAVAICAVAGFFLVAVVRTAPRADAHTA